MNLYIKIEGGQPVGHPIIESNLLHAFEMEAITDSWLTENGFARYERVDSPSVMFAGDPTYQLGEDGVVRPSYQMAEMTQEEKIERWIRMPRRQLLAWSDWTQLPDAPLTAEEKAAWAAVRQQLRDMTETYANAQSPAEIVFPTAPTSVK